jgi:hypothetical protein
MVDLTRCARCGRDAVVPAKVRRYTGAVVVLGFLLIVGGVIGVGMGAVARWGGKQIAAAAERPPEERRRDLEAAGVPERLIAKAMGETEEPMTANEFAMLDETQLTAFQQAQFGTFGDRISPDVVRRLSRILLVASAIALLIGWTLRQKKEVLRCAACGQVAAETGP